MFYLLAIRTGRIHGWALGLFKRQSFLRFYLGISIVRVLRSVLSCYLWYHGLGVGKAHCANRCGAVRQNWHSLCSRENWITVDHDLYSCTSWN